MLEKTQESAKASSTQDSGQGPRKPVAEHDLLREIPSPTRRLWLGLCVTLAIFVIFASYTIREIRWLQDFQVNVVQKNRKDSLQLLGLQDDTYQLAVSLRDMTLPGEPLPDFLLEGQIFRVARGHESTAGSGGPIRPEHSCRRCTAAATARHPRQLLAALRRSLRSGGSGPRGFRPLPHPLPTRGAAPNDFPRRLAIAQLE